MKRILQILLLLTLLTPSFLWIYDAQSHRLGSLGLEGSRAIYSHMRRVSSTSYPVLRDDHLFLISISDPYIYEFRMDEQPVNLGRYEIGGKAKAILYQDEGLVIGYQDNRIKNHLVGLKTFDFDSREIKTLAEKESVTGEMPKNMVIFDGWVYTWALEDDEIVVICSNGRQVRRMNLGVKLQPDSEAGFHLNENLANLPLFEVRGETTKAFLLRPSGIEALAMDEDGYKLPLIDETAFLKLKDSGRYSRFYLSGDYLLARLDSSSEDWEDLLTQWIKIQDLVEQTEEELERPMPRTHGTDVFYLPDLTLKDHYFSTSYLYPEDLAVSGNIDLTRNREAVRAQEKVVMFYQELLDENKAALEVYMQEHQLKNFVTSPTSIFLLLTQIILGVAGFKALKKGGVTHEF